MWDIKLQQAIDAEALVIAYYLNHVGYKAMKPWASFPEKEQVLSEPCGI